jgi:hypothetical protein
MTEHWRYEEVDAPRLFPWPPAEDDSILGALGETWKSASLEPSDFFSRLPPDGGTRAAVAYYLAVGVLAAGAKLFWESLGGGGMDPGQFAELGVGEGVGPVVSFLLSPLLLLFGLVLAGGVTHLMLLVVGGATHGFDTTLRVFCYAYSPQILGIIPVVGSIIGTVWMLVIAIIGLRAAHRSPTWKPALAVMLPFLLLLGLLAVGLMLLAAGASVLA